MRILLPFAIIAGTVLFSGCTATVVEERHGGHQRYGYSSGSSYYGSRQPDYYDGSSYRTRSGYSSGSSYHGSRQPDYYDGSSYRARSGYSSGYSHTRTPYPSRANYDHSSTVDRTDVSNTYVNRTNVNRTNVNNTYVNRTNVDRTNVSNTYGNGTNVVRKSAPVPTKTTVPTNTKKQSPDKKGKKKQGDQSRA